LLWHVGIGGRGRWRRRSPGDRVDRTERMRSGVDGFSLGRRRRGSYPFGNDDVFDDREGGLLRGLGLFDVVDSHGGGQWRTGLDLGQSFGCVRLWRRLLGDQERGRRGGRRRCGREQGRCALIGLIGVVVGLQLGLLFGDVGFIRADERVEQRLDQVGETLHDPTGGCGGRGGDGGYELEDGKFHGYAPFKLGTCVVGATRRDRRARGRQTGPPLGR